VLKGVEQVQWIEQQQAKPTLGHSLQFPDEHVRVVFVVCRLGAVAFAEAPKHAHPVL